MTKTNSGRQLRAATLAYLGPFFSFDGKGGIRDRSTAMAWDLLTRLRDRRALVHAGRNDKVDLAEAGRFVRLRGYRDPAFYRDHIAEALLPFWVRHAVDTEHGGFFTHLDRAGRVYDARYKHAAMQARMIYAFSAGYEITNNPLYLQLAQHGVRFMRERMWDAVHHGWYKTVWREQGVREADKESFVQSYAVIGLTEYWRVTHDESVAAQIEHAMDLLDRHAWDEAGQGYYWSCSREWQVTCDTKTICAQLDMMFAHFGLFLLTGSAARLARVEGLAALIVTRMQDLRHGCLLENFTSSWIYDPLPTRDALQAGHLLKAAWLFLRLYQVTHQQTYLAHARRWLDYAMRHAWDAVNGGFFQHIYRNGGLASTVKEWWPECEGLLAFSLAGSVTGEPVYWEFFDRLAAFTFASFWDRKHGEWVLSVAPAGTIHDERKGCDWKAAYHTVQTCSEVMHYLADLPA
jgi:mannose/cellobiose epimerase-like protein (N-acyl-D-glucosamine 2-epimerase family)